MKIFTLTCFAAITLAITGCATSSDNNTSKAKGIVGSTTEPTPHDASGAFQGFENGCKADPKEWKLIKSVYKQNDVYEEKYLNATSEWKPLYGSVIRNLWLNKNLSNISTDVSLQRSGDEKEIWLGSHYAITIEFKNAAYRGQNLKSLEYIFRPETDDFSARILTFADDSEFDSLKPYFKGRSEIVQNQKSVICFDWN